MRIIIVVVFILFTSHVFAFCSDTLKIKSISIYGTIYFPNTKQEKIDSIVRISMKFSSISEVLAQTSAMTIKSYGPGLTSSPSLRGGNAQQTLILWNGLNIQNSMLGQVDLSSLPFGLFSATTVDFTSQSSAGNNAVSGSIVLDDEKSTNKVEIGTMYTSLNGINNLFKVSFRKLKFTSSTKIFHQYNQNNYKFRNYTLPNKPIVEMQNLTQKMLVILQENSYQISKNTLLKSGIWYTKRNRIIPPTILQDIPGAKQNDESLKAMISSLTSIQNSTLQFRIAFQKDVLDYLDTGITGLNNWKGVIAEGEWKKYFNGNNTLDIIYNSSNFLGTSNSYHLQNTSIQNRQSISANHKLVLHNNICLISNASLQQVNYQKIFPQFKLQFQKDFFFSKGIKANTNLAIYNAFRFPTLNDLYWNPGGNINLQPEKGFCQELNLAIEKNSIKLECSVFNKNIKNWIIWLPTNGYWSPENIALVWNRGVEGSVRWFKKFNQLSIITKINYTRVLATNQKIDSGHDVNLYKQLIYVPLNKSGALLTFQYKKIFATCSQQYLGYRYTNAENTEFLNPYWITNLLLGYSLENKKNTFEFTCNINNLFNAEYESIAYRPMPLRYLETGINIKFK